MRVPLFIAFLAAWTSWAHGAWNIVLYDGRRYVPIEDVGTFYHLNYPVVNGNGFRLISDGHSIAGQADTREILINGVKYVLCFPVVTSRGKTLISAMDVVKIIEPILRPQKIRNASAVRTVVLDAGHGGQDSGARGPYGSEKDAALDVVLRAKKLLEAGGYQVHCTRTTDVFIPLEERAEIANRYLNALFVSVHFNKSNVGGGTGLETYCLAPRGVPSMDEENLSYSDYTAYPGHARDAENVALATTVHASLVRSLGLTDRGIKRARFVVIKNITIPGILVEGGFMSGSPDAQMIATTSYRQEMAQCIVDGINRYRDAIAGQLAYQKPSAVVGIDPAPPRPTPRPTPVPPVGSRTDMDSSVVAAKNAIEGSH